MQKLIDTWPVIVFTMIITLLGSMGGNWYINRNSTIQNAAPYDYVDRKDYELKALSDEGDRKLEAKLDTKADKELVLENNRLIKTMDSRIYDLWKERNK